MNLNEPHELSEPIECNHNICNPYVRTWYDEKFKHADQAAFQLTKFTKVYYDDDGIFTCPDCNTLYIVKGNNGNSQKVIAKKNFGKEPGDNRRPTIYITDINDIKQLYPRQDADVIAKIIMMKIIHENKFEHYIMDSGLHTFFAQPAVINWFPDSKPLLLRDAHKYIRLIN